MRSDIGTYVNLRRFTAGDVQGSRSLQCVVMGDVVSHVDLFAAPVILEIASLAAGVRGQSRSKGGRCIISAIRDEGPLTTDHGTFSLPICDLRLWNDTDKRET